MKRIPHKTMKVSIEHPLYFDQAETTPEKPVVKSEPSEQVKVSFDIHRQTSGGREPSNDGPEVEAWKSVAEHLVGFLAAVASATYDHSIDAAEILKKHIDQAHLDLLRLSCEELDRSLAEHGLRLELVED